MQAFTNSKKKRWLFFFLSLLLVIPTSIFFQGQKNSIDAASSDYKLVGYYTSWGPPANLDPNKLTHINFAFADVCWDGEHGNPEVWAPEGKSSTWPCTDLQGNEVEVPDGSVVLGDPEGDFKALQKLRELKEINPNLKTLVSIGGWSWSYNISLAARTEETRKNFAQSAVEYVREFDMDGVDLDWEYPVEGGMWNNHRDPSDKQNHTLLLQEIRNALNEAEAEDGKEYLLTIASSVSFTYTDNNELDKISEIVDFINIMTYDFNGTWAPMSAHNAPLYEDGRATDAGVHPYHIDQAIEGHLQAGVPKNKLVMGLPFYGRSWGNCNEENNGEMTSINGGYQLCDGNGGGDLEPGVYSYDYIRAELINKNGYKYYWNNIAKVPYLYNDENGEFITFDNVESIGYKTNYIKEKGLAGGMIWELSQDDKEFNLLKTASSNLGISSEAPIEEPEEPIEEPEVPNNGEDPGESKDNDTGEDEVTGDDNEDNGAGKDENTGDGNEDNGSGEDENTGDGNEDNGSGEDENTGDDNVDNGTGEDENTGDGNENTGTGNNEESKDEDKDNGSGANVDIVDKGDVNEGSKTGDKLPSTASNMFNRLAVGTFVILIGVGMFYMQRKRHAKKE